MRLARRDSDRDKRDAKLEAARAEEVADFKARLGKKDQSVEKLEAKVERLEEKLGYQTL